MEQDNQLLLSAELRQWISADDRLELEYDAQNNVISTIFLRDRYIFENKNSSDEEYLAALDVTKHYIEDSLAKKNIKKLIMEAQYYLETGIAIHDMQV